MQQQCEKLDNLAETMQRLSYYPASLNKILDYPVL